MRLAAGLALQIRRLFARHAVELEQKQVDRAVERPVDGVQEVLDRDSEGLSNHDVTEPMSKQDDPGHRERGRQTPDQKSVTRGQSAEGGSEGSHVDRMSRRKCIERLSRAGDAMAIPVDFAAIRSLLIDDPLQEMRQDRRRHHRQ